MADAARAARGAHVGPADARPRVLATLTFVLVAVVTPITLWPLYIVEAAVVLSAYAVGGRPWRVLLLRLAALLPLVTLLAGSVVLSRALQDGWLLAIQMLARSLLAVTAVTSLVVTTPFTSILAAMGRLQVPAALVSILTFMYRYLSVLGDELTRMRRAMEARTFQESRLHETMRVASLTGLLFVRAFERAERVQAAMYSRGWDGRVPPPGRHE